MDIFSGEATPPFLLRETQMLQFQFGVCACIVHACVRVCMRSSIGICPGHNFYIFCSGKLKVKVKLEDQMTKWS